MTDPGTAPPAPPPPAPAPGESAPPTAPRRPRNYRATDSDHITFIAERDGYANWEVVWNANGTLAGQRANPSILFKGVRFSPRGDRLRLPGITEAEDTGGTEEEHNFVAPDPQLSLRLRILNEDFTAMQNASYRLTVDGTVFTGDTDANGQLEHEVTNRAQHGELQITPPTPPAGGGGGGAGGGGGGGGGAGGAPPPTPEQRMLGRPLRYTLRIGKLNPIVERTPDRGASGVQQRLNNLGYRCGAADGRPGTASRAAIRQFQQTFGITPETGRPDTATQAKLKQIHDDPESIVAPTNLEATQPTAGAASATRLRPGEIRATGTPRAAIGTDVGHVAPDHDGRPTKHFNTLRFQPIYRISIRLAENFEMLFPDDASTPNGRKARLQAISYFHLPLNDPRSDDCLVECWSYFRRNAVPHSALTDAEAEVKLKEMVQTQLIKGIGDGRLPEHDEFSKLLIPGHYTFFRERGRFNLGDNRFPRENTYYDQNSGLGKFPLIAKVERLDAHGRWHPAENARVFFQLVEPAALNDAVDRPATRRNPTSAPPPDPAPPAAGAPFQPAATRSALDYIDVIKAQNAPAADDPQVDNIHRAKGGKRGRPVAGNLFVTGDQVQGFHVAPAGGGALGHSEFAAAEDGAPDVEHSVKCLTNDEGEAGVLFTPSRCGGDRYKIRAFVGPGTLSSDGTEIEDDRNVLHVVETGTMVVWRRARIAHLLTTPIPANIDPAILNDADLQTVVQNHYPFDFPPPGGGSAQDNMNNVYRRYLGIRREDGTADPGLGEVDLLPGGWVSEEFGKSFMEMEIDNHTQEEMTVDQWRAAFEEAVRRAGATDGTGAGARNRFHFQALLEFNPNDPCWISIRGPRAYNARCAALALAGRRMRAPNPRRAHRDSIEDLIQNHLLNHMMDHFSRNGLLPGLTILYSPLCDMHAALEVGGIPNSGIATSRNGCYLFYGEETYNRGAVLPFTAYRIGQSTLNSNAVHESGHCFYCLHQHHGGATGGDNRRHDRRDRCVMSYEERSYGEFCGECLLMLGGLNINSF